jgi:cytoskeleton protein RodZ
MTVEKAQEENASTLISPGALLRQARVAREMSLDDVSGVLHLDVELIAALEADDYENLPASTFVKGYLRGYARLLNLNADSLVEAFECQGCKDAYIVADISVSSQIDSNDVLMKIVTLGVIVALIALVFLWWQTQPEQSDTNGLNDISVEKQASDISYESSGSYEVESGRIGVQPESASLMKQESVPEAQPITMLADEPVLAEMEVENTQDIPVAQIVQSEVVNEPAESLDETIRDKVVLTETQDSLVIHFKYDSWVEIYARDNKKLYYNIAKKGKTLSLQGLAPIKVLIGYARGLSIEYNGKPFDAGPFTNKQIARFTLGGNAPATVNALN